MNSDEKKRIEKALKKESEKDSFYVYMLCEGKKPFYIGKGKGSRVWQHEEGYEEKKEEIKERLEEINSMIDNEISKAKDSETKLSLEEKRLFLISQVKKDIGAKYDKIEKLRANNIDVNKVIVKWGLTENEAFMVESALMNMYFYINDTSINENTKRSYENKVLTNIVNGHMSKKEKLNISHESKARTVEEFLEQCAVESILITELKNTCIMIVNIGKSYFVCKDLDEDLQEKAIYDCSRAAWHIGVERQKYLDKIEYVFAVYDSQVVGIYKVDSTSWCQIKDLNELYDFPIYPLSIREREWKYISALKDMDTFQQAQDFCKKTDGFNENDLIEIIGRDFDSWKNRFCFVASIDNIPEEILRFKNKVLSFPVSNGDTRKMTQNDKFNFNIITNKSGDVIEIKKIYN